MKIPLRIDIAGGWLDVPKLSKPNSYIVNCAISPFVSKEDWPYKTRAGLGGSAAWDILNGNDGIKSELDLGVGWQDGAVIKETGLCVWKSGHSPELEIKTSGNPLRNKMALLYTGYQHDTPNIVNKSRDYERISKASNVARIGVINNSLELLSIATNISYEVQLDEGMEPLPENDDAIAKKYCGGGFGGYALYLFNDSSKRDKFLLEEDVIGIEVFSI